MKMKTFICVILIFSFTSGAVAPSQPVDSARTNIDSLIIEQAAQEYIDSATARQQAEIDSLSIVVDSIRQERGKRLFTGSIDRWRGSDGKIHTWKWLYWRYPNGQVQFHRTLITKE